MKRNEVDSAYKWKLETLCESDEIWEKRYQALKSKIGEIEKFKGTLSDKKSLLKMFKVQEEQGIEIEQLYAYAKMRFDEDTKSSKYKTMSERIENLYVKFSAENSFVTPELSRLSDKYLRTLIEDKNFADYDYFFKKLIKDKKYILSAKEEKLLAKGGEVFGSASAIFSMINNADIKFEKVKDSNGNLHEMSHGLYSVYMQSPDRTLRKNAFKALYKPFKDNIHTITQVYSSNVSKDWFISSVRGYKSCMNRALQSEDVDSRVYDNLLKAVSRGFKNMHRYVALRKRVLKLRNMHMYDMYLPIVENAEIAVSYEDACKIVKEGLLPLGKDYGKLLDRAFNEGWIDVFENEGKRSGAYSFGTYRKNPFIMLNYQKTTHDVFTIAHELGHSLHSYYSDHALNYNKAGYTIFVAEVASTVNEVLLLKHLIKETKDENLKKFLLSYYLDMFRTTLFRQTKFSEFEALAHKLVEEDTPLSVENLSEMYLDLNKKYYGKSIVYDEEIKYEWARIPHFYRSFYVYKYATGLTAAVSIAKSILEEGEPAVKRYKAFLSSGGSDSPVELLKIAGVDLLTAKPFRDAMHEFEETLKALSALL